MVDAAGKLNMIGGGWQYAGIDPQTGYSAPQTLVVTVLSPPQCYRDEFALELALRDSLGHLVQLPTATGEPQALRIANNMAVKEPQSPAGAYVPRGVMWAQSIMVTNLANGIPGLQVGQQYAWQVSIDGDSRSEWSYSFFVPGAPPGPVLG